MKLSTLFGISATITGAVAITSNFSSISSTATSTSPTETVDLWPAPTTKYDQVYVSYGAGEHCNITSFSREHFLYPRECNSFNTTFTTLRSRFVEGNKTFLEAPFRCVLATFSDPNCAHHGTIVQDFSQFDNDPTVLVEETDDFLTTYSTACLELFTMPGAQRIPARSMKWTCGGMIDPTWVDPFIGHKHDLPISARSADAEHDKDHVTVVPADNLNCNSAQDRDTDTKLQGHCHSFDKPFSSLSATIKRADHDSKIGGSEPCSVLVFSDKKCRMDGASIVDLNSTPSLGVCHNVTLHQGKDTAAIAGHSWKWVCGRQNIDNCLKPIAHHSKASKHHSETHTVVNSATKTVTATTSLACSMTTEFAHYLDVLTSVVTLKPVTHTSTSVFTKTKTLIRTKIITSVATDVSTVHHSVTKPYTTTYMVCDAEEGSQV